MSLALHTYVNNTTQLNFIREQAQCPKRAKTDKKQTDGEYQ